MIQPGEEAATSTSTSSDGAVPLPHGPGYCNSYIKRKGSYCGQPEGWGTGYKIGPCRKHGGMLPRVRRRAAEETYHLMYADKTMFGQKLDVDPQTGIVDLLGYQWGDFLYLRSQLLAKADPETGELNIGDISDSEWKRYTDAAAAVARTHKMAGDLQVANRITNLIKARQDTVIDLIKGILADAGHDPESPESVSIITRRLELIADDDTEAAA